MTTRRLTTSWLNPFVEAVHPGHLLQMVELLIAAVENHCLERRFRHFHWSVLLERHCRAGPSLAAGVVEAEHLAVDFAQILAVAPG